MTQDFFYLIHPVKKKSPSASLLKLSLITHYQLMIGWESAIVFNYELQNKENYLLSCFILLILSKKSSINLLLKSMRSSHK